jgi:hypothetical protein
MVLLVHHFFFKSHLFYRQTGDAKASIEKDKEDNFWNN